MPGVDHDSSAPMATIDLRALSRNYGRVRALVGSGVQVLAMVKADAYGHGAPQVAVELARAGCRCFGVATVDEAEAIAASVREVAGDARIAVLGGIVPAEAGRALRLGLEVGTQEIAVAEALGACAAAMGREAAVHVKIDSGMTRLGLQPGDAAEFARRLREIRGIRPVALFSHFAQAESVSGEVTRGQLEAVEEAARAFREAGLDLPRHLANSAGILTRPEAHLDMVRPGLMLYGLYPDPALRELVELEPVMTLSACVVRVADIPAGRGVSYGHTFHTARRSRIATLRCGYADGYPRALSNCGVAKIRGVEVPVVGRVCMDHSMLDVSAVDGVQVGDRAVMWGADPATERIAESCGTIAYELVARVGRRVLKNYRR